MEASAESVVPDVAAGRSDAESNAEVELPHIDKKPADAALQGPLLPANPNAEPASTDRPSNNPLRSP
jgi:hypothetical protein